MRGGKWGGMENGNLKMEIRKAERKINAEVAFA
jgi:hypothetical protein